MVFSVAFAYASGSAGFADVFGERNFKTHVRVGMPTCANRHNGCDCDSGNANNEKGEADVRPRLCCFIAAEVAASSAMQFARWKVR